VTAVVVSSWETGRSVPSFSGAIAIAKALGVSVDSVAEAFVP